MQNRTDPLGVITSLVSLTFLTAPVNNSSSVHWRFLSTGGGFLLTAELEKRMGLVAAVALRLAVLRKAAEGSVSGAVLGPFDSVDPTKVGALMFRGALKSSVALFGGIVVVLVLVLVLVFV